MSGEPPPAVQVRPLQMTDDPSVAALLTAISTHNPAGLTEPGAHGPAVDEPGRYRRTLVIETHDSLVGVGTIWES